MTNRTLFLCFVALTSINTRADQFIGHIFTVGKTNEAPLYTQKVTSEQTPDGLTHVTSQFLDSNGKPVLQEKAIIEGTQFISQEIENFAEKKVYTAEMKDKRLTFQTFSLQDNGEKKFVSSSHETVRGNFVTGAVAENFIRQHWQDFMDGKRIDARFAVFEREETIGFSFKKQSEKDVDGKPAMVIVMRPTSLFVSMVVAPMEISVDKNSKAIIHFKGRTPLKIAKGKNLIGDIVFDRPSLAITRATATDKHKH